MKNLEEKVLKEVYSYESKQTLLKLILRLIALFSFIFGAVLIFGLIVERLIQQKTTAIFEIFSEDFEIIRENIWEVINTFVYEAPSVEILLAILTLILLMALFLNIVLNFTRIKNKLIWLIKFLLKNK